MHSAGVTQCNFHALDTNIFVWLLPRRLNMSAVPSTDSCAVSSPPDKRPNCKLGLLALPRLSAKRYWNRGQFSQHKEEITWAFWKAPSHAFGAEQMRIIYLWASG